MVSPIPPMPKFPENVEEYAAFRPRKAPAVVPPLAADHDRHNPFLRDNLVNEPDDHNISAVALLLGLIVLLVLLVLDRLS